MLAQHTVQSQIRKEGASFQAFNISLLFLVAANRGSCQEGRKGLEGSALNIYLQKLENPIASISYCSRTCKG